MSGGISALGSNPGACDVYKHVYPLGVLQSSNSFSVVQQKYADLSVSQLSRPAGSFAVQLAGSVSSVFTDKAKHSTADPDYMEAYFSLIVSSPVPLLLGAAFVRRNTGGETVGAELTVVSSCLRGSLNATELGAVWPTSDDLTAQQPLIFPPQTYTFIVAARRADVQDMEALYINFPSLPSSTLLSLPPPPRVTLPSESVCSALIAPTPPAPTEPSPLQKFLNTAWLGPLTGLHILIIGGGTIVLLLLIIIGYCCWRRAVKRRKLMLATQAATQRAMQNRGKRNTMRGSVLGSPLPVAPLRARSSRNLGSVAEEPGSIDDGTVTKVNPLNEGQGSSAEGGNVGDQAAGSQQGGDAGAAWHINNMRKIEVPNIAPKPPAPPMTCPNCGIELSEATAHRDELETLRAENQHLKSMLSRWGTAVKGGRTAALASQAARGFARGRKVPAAMQAQGTTGDYEFAPQPTSGTDNAKFGRGRGDDDDDDDGLLSSVGSRRVLAARGRPGVVTGASSTAGTGAVSALAAARNAGLSRTMSTRAQLANTRTAGSTRNMGATSPATAIPVAPLSASSPSPSDSITPRSALQPSSRLLSSPVSSRNVTVATSNPVVGVGESRRLLSSPSSRGGWQQVPNPVAAASIAGDATSAGGRGLASAPSSRALSAGASSRDNGADGAQVLGRGPSASQRTLAARSPSRRLLLGGEGSADTGNPSSGQPSIRRIPSMRS